MRYAKGRYSGKKRVVYIYVVLLMLISCSEKQVAVREEFSTPEKSYRFWLNTAENGDIPNNMKSITEASTRIMDSQLGNMDVFISRLNENVRVFKAYTLAEQRMKEDKAIVVLKGAKGEVLVVPLKKEAEGWKIDLISLFGGR